MSDDALIRALLQGGARQSVIPGSGGDGNLFTHIAQALIQGPRLAEERARQSQLADLGVEKAQLGLDKSRFDLTTARSAEERAQSQEERAQAAESRLASDADFVQGERDVALEKRLRKEADKEALFDARPGIAAAFQGRKHATPESQALLEKTFARYPELREQLLSQEKQEEDIKTDRIRASRPPGSGTQSKPKVLLGEAGEAVFMMGDGSVVDSKGAPYQGQVFPSDALRKPREQISTFNQVSAFLDTAERRFHEMDETSFINFIQKADNIALLNRALLAIATPFGRAVGEDRITDADRIVYYGIIGGGSLRAIAEQAGLPVESIGDSLAKLRDTMYDIQQEIVRTQHALSGARLDVTAEERRSGNLPPVGQGGVLRPNVRAGGGGGASILSSETQAALDQRYPE